MHIRPARKSEALQIAELINLAMLEITYQFIGEENVDKANEFLAHFIAQENNQYSYENIYIAEEDGLILGQISMYDGGKLKELRQPIWDKIKVDRGIDYWSEDETQAGEIYIDTFAVSPLTQGKGIGKQLLQYAIDDIVMKQHKVLGLLVDNDNPDAKRLYERIGFKVVNEVNIFGKNMEHLQYA
ncbi:GNAT family N-acetyltransferase [Sphingobacterium bovistauri]|uniref:GNAT family N-acetyltransferase n=1 Tax=Sphingobacterium bovistauri TaxID=2781959 RepID=A0ABS7Z8U1_9SPHI|nr:GNAT family N-acetyltransferase [Sphingobacterium bovistauri]MCA5006615.1 GNAT family N-acetyltransferase [Sphingobacterium bovistauri]